MYPIFAAALSGSGRRSAEPPSSLRSSARAKVDRALGLAAEAGRFADGDLESILDHLRLMGDRTNESLDGVDGDETLQPGTSAWELVGPVSGIPPVHDPYQTRGRLRGLKASDEFARWRDQPPRLRPVEPAPYPPDVLHRLRLQYMRQAGPAILARARGEGWDYAQVLKVLLAEEAQPAATVRPGRRTARRPGCRRARPSMSGTRWPRRSWVTLSGRSGPSTDRPGRGPRPLSVRQEPANRTSPRRSTMPRSTAISGSIGSPWRR
jgi:hypothetical protein